MPASHVSLVTGGNGGLGFETARNIAAASSDNALILACRDPLRGEQAQKEIERQTGNSRVRVVELDLTSLTSVRNCASLVTEPIDALVCNAGISRGPEKTIDGLDGVFETNHLGHFLLTVLLRDRISPNGRVVSVSSDMHAPPGPRLRWPGARALAYPNRSPAVAGYRYSFSKLCNLYFAYELARRLHSEGSGISVDAFNPGLMTETNFARVPRPIGAVMRRIFASRLGNLETSGAALAQLATVPRTPSADGLYFDRTAAAPSRSSELSYDANNARDLWDLSVTLTGTDL